jgi:predicted nucleic acid-binding protein
VRLVVDASVLVAELLRKKGQERFLHPELVLFIAEPTWQEVTHELAKRQEILVARKTLSLEAAAGIVQNALTVARRCVYIISQRLLEFFEEEATWRIPRDTNDWPSIALALLLSAGIWTQDQDYFGCGLPIWTTEVLDSHLKFMNK